MTTNETIHAQQKENAWENARKQNQVLEWIHRCKARRREKDLVFEKQFTERQNMINRSTK